MSKALLAVLVACVSGCGVQHLPSQRQMQAMHEARMQQMLESMQSQLQGQQDLAAGRDTEAARAYRQYLETAQQQNDQLQARLREHPDYARRQEEELREERDEVRRNPSRVETEFNLSDAEEAELGFGMAQQFLANQRLVADEALQRYVNAVGAWIARQSERPGLPWRFAVTDDETPNAFAVPGGYVFITRGMLALAETESELAGILGHEISHIVRKHHLRWIYMNKELQTSVQRAEEHFGTTSKTSRDQFRELGKLMQRSFEQLNSPETRAGMSQGEEFEADVDGAVLAWRAGYEAWGLVAVMQRFEAASRDQYKADTQLAGHPEPLQRFKILDLALRSRDEKDTLGESAADRFQRAMQSLRRRPG